MFSSFRNRFGIPGVISVIALVFAMFGGAYAASDNSGDATASAKKAKKGPRGSRGPKGLAGAAGPAGPVGPQGPAGAAGANGKDGQGVELSAAEECPEGGTTLTVGTQSIEICNGEEGEEGPQGPAGPDGINGEPWVAGTVPSGKVMKGTWVLPPATAAAGGDSGDVFYAAVSTGVPINELNPFSEEMVVFTTPPICNGTAADPAPPVHPVTGEVPPGIICVYKDPSSVNIKDADNGVSRLKQSGGGVVLGFRAQGAGPVSGYGSWALGTP